MAAALVANQAVAFLGVRRAADVTARGQAQSLIEAFADELGTLDRFPTEEDLSAFIAGHAEDGVRFVAVRHRGDTVRSGETRFGEGDWPRNRVEEEAGHVRAGTALAPLRFEPVDDGPLKWRRWRSADWRPPGRPVWPFGVRGPPPQILVEFEPILSGVLERDARTTLAIGALAALLFLAFALAFRRALIHRTQLAKRAAQDRRLAALGAMSAVLAHEIRNPLASLKGHAQLLLESSTDHSAARASADRVVHEAMRLERLTTDLLEFIRSGRLEMRAVDPEALVSDAIEAVDGARFIVHNRGTPPTVVVDPERMHQVLVNLLRNAAQASDAPVEVTVASPTGCLEIEVRDRGAGIPAGEEGRIFEAFHTTRIHGTGLGLAVTRHIVEAHGGEIVASNHPGGGAVFRISVPATAEG